MLRSRAGGRPVIQRVARILGVAATVLVVSTASAQTAADKATARKVATEGIELYNAGKFEEALDRLKRAQALYDAPPHLLYMARAQRQLDPPLLVEAAENYQLIVKKELEADAPQAFVQAQADARKELEELEPRIPSLQITVKPEEVDDPKLTIDGAEVAAAVIGISRPINPGEHVVAVSAGGHDPVEKKVQVPEGEKVELLLELTPSKGGVVGSEKPAEPGSETKETKKKQGTFGFMGGLRLGAVFPGGKLGTLENRNRSTTDFFEPGGGLEIHAGVRFARIVTAALFGEFSALTGPKKIEAAGVSVDVESSASARTVGVKVMVGTPRGKLGGFGEIGFGIAHSFEVSVQGTRDIADCKITRTYQGPARLLRIGGGAVFPIGSLIHIVPFGALSIGSFASANTTVDGCLALPFPFDRGDRDIPDADEATHTLLMLGVGGDFVFGADAP
jgi:hypothetical protein